MEGQYQIFRDGECVGNAEVKKNGLYYHFNCRCQLRDGEHIHLKLSCDSRVTDLGLCVPMGDCFGVETSVPVKRIGSGTAEFFLGDRKKQAQAPEQEKALTVRTETPERIVPIDPQQPFEHLTELEGAVLQESDGEKMIQLKQPAPEQPDSDQNPLPDSE